MSDMSQIWRDSGRCNTTEAALSPESVDIHVRSRADCYSAARMRSSYSECRFSQPRMNGQSGRT
jgi:hypothetical protein